MNPTKPELGRLLLNLGCGPMAEPTHWHDYDGSWNVLASSMPLGLGWLSRKVLGHGGKGFPRHVRYMDITKRLPFADRSVDAIYFSHVLEHLYLDEGKRLLADCLRILRPGGAIRVLVPDTEYFLNDYLAKAQLRDSDACYRLNEMLGFRVLTSRGNFLKRMYAAATDFHTHKFMYDRAYLARCLADAGFTRIDEAHYGTSRIPEVQEIEIEIRLGGGNGFGFEAERAQAT